MDIKGETDRNTVGVGDFNIPLSSMDRPSRQKINRERAASNDTLDQMDRIHTYRAFQPGATEHAFFSSAQGTVARTDHMLGHNTSLDKFKKTDIVASIFSDHNAMKGEFNHKKKTEKYTKTGKLTDVLLNSEWANSEIKEEIKRYLETNDNEHTATPNLQDPRKALLGGKCTAVQAYLKEQEKAQINDLTLQKRNLKKSNKAQSE